MRITCPNCGAQYEVPAEVIPQDGRDVQCSNCGVTWFQPHPDHAMDPDTAERAAAAVPPGPEEAVDEDYGDYGEGGDAPEPPASEAERARRELDPGIADILRQEAAHEARLRGSEPLESQPDLGLEDPAPESPATRARNRTQPARQSDPMEDPVGSSRRDLLPDIEEINSTLRSENSRSVARRVVYDEDDEAEAPRRNGFSRGFATMLILAVLLVLLYANAPMLSQKVPVLDAFLNGLVNGVDRVRLWLDAQVKSFSG
ncbi:zinc-ribbon domain-containing protein [Marinibacterium profundimaris]|uniref:Zinc finger/thioredoxin putative domain-containing protein n=1 Tax=Marinibacterium profundimaris TaxID=1679460 RepID=A0A225NHY7_9RHOB|nr:zinc-ribbon domain-containing protein [Marinibacterium profundimaris]OWU73354.1 hypothetical protein ATO3_11710 [Marinibacterium profundimaris]